jgi:hypothetical protein
VNCRVSPPSVLFAPFEIVDNMFTSKSDRLHNIDSLKIVQPAPEIDRLHLWRPITSISPSSIYPRYNPILLPRAGDVHWLIRRFFERFVFGRQFSLFPVADVVFAVSGVSALPAARIGFVANPNCVRRGSNPQPSASEADTLSS